MTVEFLFWEGCPSHPKALAELREAMSELGLDQTDISVHEIRNESDAERERFVGSPTIRIDGLDIQQTEDEPYGLNCRVYHRRDGRVSPTPDPSDGRVSPTPDPSDVREALVAAQANRTTNSPNPDSALDAGSPDE